MDKNINQKKSVGIYGGSFDPIHFGHLNLAVELTEAKKLDEVWFCPAARSPFKPDKSQIDDKHRLAMLKLAVESEPRFSITDVDILRAPPSYTVDTLHLLKDREKKEGREASFSLILGKDAAVNFHHWKEPFEILRLAHVIVGERRSKDGIAEVEFHENDKLEYVHTRVMEISSTEVRKRLHQRKYCGHLVPAKVLDYIFANNLYYTRI